MEGIFAGSRRIEERIGIDHRRGICLNGLRNERIFRMFCKISLPDGVLTERLHGGYRIELCLIFPLLVYLSRLESEESHHYDGYQDKADYGILIHLRL